MKRRSAGTNLMTLREALPLIEAELERARRYTRPLSLVILTGGDLDRFPTRVPDIVVRIDRSRAAIVAPETDAEAADVLARRACAITGAEIDGLASFPADGHTVGGLLRSASAPVPTALGSER